MSHADSVTDVTVDFLVTGQTIDCPVASMADEKNQRYGLQFHPEVAHTQEGMQILKNFVFGICQCKQDWSIDKYFKQIVADVKKIVGKRKVFLLVSGGVDSTVCFALLEKILGKSRVFGLHIDNGFMRQDESKKVKIALAKAGFDELVVVNFEDKFLSKLKGVIDPEAKRHIIGRDFLNAKDEFMRLDKMN